MQEKMEMKHNDLSPEVVTFGESMALMMPAGTKGIEFSPQFTGGFGGAESNVAIGLARLGRRVGWFSRLGNDPLGRMIMKKIRGEGVDTSRVEFTDAAPTGLMFREVVSGKSSVYYYRKNSAASTMNPEFLDRDYIQSARILHMTGITPALSASCRKTMMEAIAIAREAGVKVCFDPNLRLKLWGLEEAREVIMDIAKQSDIFMPGLDELKLLFGTDDFDAIVARLRELDAVSIVKGDGETYVVTKDSIEAVPFFKVDKVVDTIGAGDGFCAGFLSGLLDGNTYKEAVRIGNLIGSMVIQMEGDWEGIPTRDQVDAVLQNKAHVER
jgi:2-dehydro-3-deoxygluconokinase